jgi:hypothetical protein
VSLQDATHFTSIAFVTEIERNAPRWLNAALVTAVLLLVVIQFSSLCIFPVPNALRWYGDETWLMSEAHEQIATGTVRYPIALGSTLSESKGLILSMTWLSAALYGLPTALFDADPVCVGRVVTAALSVLLLITFYFAARSFGSSSTIAFIGIALLVSTRAFLFASHSCRTDLLAGLTVLLFVWRMMQTLSDHSARWWLGYGALVVFLCVSSSIHLLTLLGPVALYFAWRRGAFSSASHIVSLVAGGVTMLLLLVAVYGMTSGSIMLFSPHSHQFGDVLSSIPILRPFSRSVQVSNLLIRAKEFWAEAPIAIFLLPVIGIGIWKRRIQSELLVAACIIVLSWLLLEGAEVNYLIHLLPLLILLSAISLSTLSRKRWHTISFATIALILIGIAATDSIKVQHTAEAIERSSDAATHAIVQSIASSWSHSERPLVLSEPPSLERLAQTSQIRVMTDHFISLPEQEESIDSTLRRLRVNYAVLYNSPTFPKRRDLTDSLYRILIQEGTVIHRATGTSGDLGRDYFGTSTWQDTLILIKLHE